MFDKSKGVPLRARGSRGRNARARRVALAVAFGLAAGGCAREEPAPSGEGGDEQIIRVAGSDDVYPLARALARQFENSHAGHRVVFTPPAHTRGGVAAISVGDADIALASRPLTMEEKETEATYLHLAHDPLVFATHRNVKVGRLTRQQLLDIYSGQISNWRELGGHDAPITVLDRSEHTSLKVILRKELFDPSFAVTPSALVLERPEDVITSLVMVENTIGYLSFGNALLEGVAVNFLGIDGARPSPESLRKEHYPYTRPFGFLLGPDPSRAVMRFVQFVYGEEGQRTIEGHGFTPVTMNLIIAVLPEQDLLAQEQRYAPLVEYLSRQFGLQTTVTLRLLPNYGEVIKEFKAGRINAAFLGSLAFALAYAQAGVTPIARPEKDGVSQYRGLIVTRKDSGIRNWADLHGKSFGLVDTATTAGYLYPLLYFREHGAGRPEDHLGSLVFTGSHDLLFLKVYEGELDAGAAKNLMLDEVAKRRPEVKEELRILAVSPPVPNNAFVLGPDVGFPCYKCHQLVPDTGVEAAALPPREPEELYEWMTGLLLSLHESPGGPEVLEALGADRFVRTTARDLDEVFRMIDQAGLDPRDYRP